MKAFRKSEKPSRTAVVGRSDLPIVCSELMHAIRSCGGPVGAPRTRPIASYCRYRPSGRGAAPFVRHRAACPSLPLTSYVRAVCRWMLNAAPAYGQSTTGLQCIGAARLLNTRAATSPSHVAATPSHSRASMTHVIRLLEVLHYWEIRVIRFFSLTLFVKVPLMPTAESREYRTFDPQSQISATFQLL